MKKGLLFIAALLLAFAGLAQDVTECHTSSTDKFAMFASNKEFNKSHMNPRVYTHVSEEGGKMITFGTPDGKDANGYVIVNPKKTQNWIFVFQEWWGLNDNVKRESEKLYKDLGNVNVLALDMYDGKVATDRETAGKYMGEFKQDRGNAIIKGALAHVGTNAKIGTIGWCFGGGESMQAALLAGTQTAACVMYYGMPEENMDRLKALNGEVLFIFAAKDKWINQDVVTKFENNMKAAGKKLTVKKYDADHGFSNPSNATIYDKTATEDAYKHALELFKAKLK